MFTRQNTPEANNQLLSIIKKNSALFTILIQEWLYNIYSSENNPNEQLPVISLQAILKVNLVLLVWSDDHHVCKI